MGKENDKVCDMKTRNKRTERDNYKKQQHADISWLLISERKVIMHVSALTFANIPEIQDKSNETFQQAVRSTISDILYPYWIELEDPEFLEFYNQTESLQKYYEELDGQTEDCIMLPQGTIVKQTGYPLYQNFIVHDCKVFERKAGPLRSMKRTKAAKKMQALPDYPLKKLYKTFDEYAQNVHGASYNEELQQYGYYYNPNGIYDYCCIGGRWSHMFLVKDTCTEYFTGQDPRGERKAPEGYRWVAAARKKDIQWFAIRKYQKIETVEYFRKLQNMFQTKEIDKGFCGHIVPEGIIRGNKLIYRNGVTLDEFLIKSVPDYWMYVVDTKDILDAEHWECSDDLWRKPDEWHKYIDQRIDAADDDTVLAVVDYHR